MKIAFQFANEELAQSRVIWFMLCGVFITFGFDFLRYVNDLTEDFYRYAFQSVYLNRSTSLRNFFFPIVDSLVTFEKSLVTLLGWKLFDRLIELPCILGLALWLDTFSQDTDTYTAPRAGQFASTMSRLCYGINLSNLFILHFVVGYMHVQAIEFTLFNYLNYAFTILLTAAFISMVTYLLIEHPATSLEMMARKFSSFGSSIADSRRSAKKTN